MKHTGNANYQFMRYSGDDTDVTEQIHEALSELEFLRFYRSKAKEMFSEGGTDEDYWICEMFKEETGKGLPEEYEEIYE